MKSCQKGICQNRKLNAGRVIQCFVVCEVIFVAIPVKSGEGPQVGSVPRIVEGVTGGALVAADLQPVLLLLGTQTEIVVLRIP